MPVQSRTYRKSFRWVEVDGLPVATVTDLNGRLWTMTCPACGCLHELIGGEIGKPYKPDCLLRKLAAMDQPHGRPAAYGANWRRVLQDWYAQHPQAAAHDTVLLLAAEAVETLVANLPQANGRTRTLTDEQRQRKAERERARRAAAGKKRGRPRKDETGEKAA